MRNEEIIEVPVFGEKEPFEVSLAGTTYSDRNYFIDRPKSTVTVIEYVISGEGTIETKNKKIHVKAGDTYVLGFGSNHRYYSNEKNPWEKIWINVSGELVSALFDAYSVGGEIIYKCNTEPLIREMHAVVGSKNLTLDEIMSESAIVFHKIVRFLAENCEKKKKIAPEAEMMKNYIDTNIYRQISIGELAEIVYKSQTHAIRIFKNAYGVTPYEYYTDNRIKKARAMLKETTYSVKQIAYMLGFGDEHYFSNIFRQKTGKKPSECR